MDNLEYQNSRLSLGDIWRGLSVVFKYTNKHTKGFRVLIALTFVLSVSTAFVPYLWGLFIDSLTQYTSNSSIISFIEHPSFMLGLLFALKVANTTLEWIKDLKQKKIEETVRTTYRLNASYHISKLPISFHTHNKLGESVEKLQRAQGGLQTILTHTILESIPALLTSAIMVGIIFSISKIFGVIALSGLLLCAVVSFLNLKPMAEIQRQSQKNYKHMWGKIADIMNNFRTVKDFSTEDYEYRNIFDNFKNKVFPLWLQFYKKQRGNSFLQNYIILLSMIAIFSLSLYFIFEGSMTIGELVAINGLISFGPILKIINTRGVLQNSIISIEEAEEILATPTEIYQPEGAAQISRLEGAVEFKNVSFAYENNTLVFSNLCFSVKAGESIAFVGESGVGKSTIIDLLLGYYFPSEGEIFFDGVDNRKIPLKLLRHHMAVVPQEITLFNDTVLNNIRYGSFDASDDAIKIAAAKAHCTEFIEKFPLKWDQVVGERGMKLSVGQKQRIAIARAFLRDPAILILDEPTSALDAHSEKVITKSVESLLKGRTTFIVAHRLSTVRNADRIFVFKNGQIVEDGDHKTLLAQGGEYAHLHNLQHKSE